MSEPQEKQVLPSDVAGDAPPAVDAGNDTAADDNSSGRDLSKANPLNQAAKSAAPGVPRTIRSRTGQTEDPLPEGKQVAEHKVRLPVVAKDEDASAETPQIAAAIAQGAHALSGREEKKAHKQELERLHGDAKAGHVFDTNKAMGGKPSAPPKNMDSRRTHYGQPQHNNSRS